MIGMRRRLVVGLAFVVAGALTRIGIFPAEPAEASPRKATRSGNATRALIQPTNGLQNVLTRNMCGGFGPCGPDMNQPWWTAYLYINYSSARPRAVMLQEICQPQMSSLNQVLPQLGYTGAKYWSNENASAECDNHGNAVFWQGGSGGSPPSGSYGVQTGEDDKRGYVCGVAASPIFLACSTHLSANNDTAAGQQAGQFLQKLDWKNLNSGPTIGAGDFNLDPKQVSEIPAQYGAYAPRYREGGYSGPTFDVTGINVPTVKLDYVWAPTFNRWCVTHDGGATRDVSPNPLGGPPPTPQYPNPPMPPGDDTSDHLMYWSYASLC